MPIYRESTCVQKNCVNPLKRGFSLTFGRFGCIHTSCPVSEQAESFRLRVLIDLMDLSFEPNSSFVAS